MHGATSPSVPRELKLPRGGWPSLRKGFKGFKGFKLKPLSLRGPTRGVGPTFGSVRLGYTGAFERRATSAGMLRWCIGVTGAWRRPWAQRSSG